MDKQRLIEEVERNIGSEWDVWLTVTFRERTLMENAKKRFKSFFKHLNKPSEVYYHKFVTMWVYYEREARGGVHVHAVVKNIPSYLTPKLEKECRQYFGQAQVKPYDRSLPLSKSATSYLADKHLSPRLEGYDFYFINSKYRRTRNDKECFNAS